MTDLEQICNQRDRHIATLRWPVEDYLRQFKATDVLFYPNPGNAGDSLIAAATFEAFSRAGVPIETAELDSPVEGHVVFLGGGGNLVPLYDNMKQAIERFLGRASKLVLLPHTIRGHEETLRTLDRTCTIICREPASYRHVRSTNPSVEVLLAHDMAFHLDTGRFLDDRKLQKEAEPVFLEKLKAANFDPQKIQERPSMNFSRLDPESRRASPVSDIDISFDFALGVGSGNAAVSAWCFLKAISLARHIATDRLHVGIGAALLGISCEFRDNTYGKNSAVYGHSMVGEFPSLRFIPD